MNEFKQVVTLCFISACFLVVSEMDYNDPIVNPEMHDSYLSNQVALEDTKDLYCEMLERNLIHYPSDEKCD